MARSGATGLIPLLAFVLCGCRAGRSPAAPMANAPSPLVIPTYDGSGQVVEPDVVVFHSPWHGFRYWMVVSPYPFTDPSKENPSIVVSNDGESWQVPDGLENPLALPTGANYLSDASIFYDSESDQLWVYYNVTLAAPENPLPANKAISSDGSEPGVALGMNRIVSSDGVHWHNDGQLFQVPNCDAVSPTVGRLGGEYVMWSVKPEDCAAATSVLTYRTSSDGVNWSVPQPTNMMQANYVIWHVNMTYVAQKKEWWAAVTAFPSGQLCCHNTRLFFCKSEDGIHWTSYGKAILNPSASGWDDDEIYRSSFLFDPQSNHIQVWYSAPNIQASYHVGLTQEDYSEFLAWLDR
jgi:dipeptidyl aminopeptidase/acylaminoacyl peptidase